MSKEVCDNCGGSPICVDYRVGRDSSLLLCKDCWIRLNAEDTLQSVISKFIRQKNVKDRCGLPGRRT